jgi:ADP-ribosylglycohydrolase
MDKVCIRYKNWYESDPFDCGSTVRAALGALTRHWRDLSEEWELIIRDSAARDIYKVSQAVNMTSKSNGSLMKICPIAVWAAEILKDHTNKENWREYKRITAADSTIIHSEPLTTSAVFVYSAAIAYLINHHTEENKAANAF